MQKTPRATIKAPAELNLKVHVNSLRSYLVHRFSDTLILHPAFALK